MSDTLKVTYSVESSFDHEDKDKEYPEHYVVVADGGDECGTTTCATFDITTSKEQIEEFIVSDIYTKHFTELKGSFKDYQTIGDKFVPVEKLTLISTGE